MMNTAYPPARWWQRSTAASETAGLVVATILCTVLTVVGQVPVNNGAGWDGFIYLQYLEMLGNGQAIHADPYRSIRLSGFIPLIGASTLGASIEKLLQLQTALNIFLMSLSAALLHDTLRQLGSSPRTAAISLATGLLAWPFLIMPVFYPVLSDNIALAISCLSLWSWVHGRQVILYLLLAYSVWVLPGLFLVPLVLAAMPRQNDSESLQPPRTWLPRGLYTAALIAALPWITDQSLQLADTHIASHSAHLDGQTAILSLRLLSSIALLVSIAFVLWLLVKAACDPGLWKSLSSGNAVMALLVLSASALAMFKLIDWSNGFTGPPLWIFMLMQSLAAPFKPLVAHFLSFGPIIFMAISGAFAWSRGGAAGLPKAPLVCLLGFMPPLIMGSESRQWVGILPVAVVIAAMSTFTFSQRWCALFFAIVLALPSLWLKDATHLAVSTTMSFQSNDWQYYFGRQGPWMSVEVYRLGVAVLVLYIVSMMGLYLLAKRRKQHPPAY